MAQLGVSLSAQAERGIASVIEAECPLCHVELRVHDDRACWPCCGDSYVVSADRLEVRQGAKHGRRCEHWEAVWKIRREA